MYRREEFRKFFRETVGAAPGTVNSYATTLNRIDAALNGLDEALATKGAEQLIEWSRTSTEPPFDLYPSNARAALKRYIGFVLDLGSEDAAEGEQQKDDPLPVASSFFRIEKEMQAAVRSQLCRVESGLVEADDGYEAGTATGRIDILARDSHGKLVVIELKAGVCPPGSLEQVLGYAQSLSDERDEAVHAILIASSFSDRLRAAVRRTLDVRLVTYEFTLSFSELG